MKTNNISNLDEMIHKCTGCQVCSAVCPTNAIQIDLTENGFYEPVLNSDKCINCGICVKSCYKYDSEIKITQEFDEITVYGAKSKDISLLKKSTSGGIASELAREGIKQGYKVIGVAYDYQKDVAVTEVAETLEQIERFRGSKYIQSYTESTFTNILKDKSNQKYIVFGTPCQIYAIDKHTKSIGKRNKFVLIDIFCHGCPSVKLWKKYVYYVKVSEKITDVNEVEFRSKKRGWHEFCVYISNGEKSFLSKNDQEGFYNIFFDNNVLTESCSDCKLRSTLEYTDIRLGDFWGALYDTDTTGVSAIVVASEVGKEAFEMIKSNIDFKKHNFEDVVKGQAYGKEYDVDIKMRTQTLEWINSDLSFDDMVKNNIKTYSVKRKIKFNLKRIVYKLPRGVKYCIRKIYHK